MVTIPAISVTTTISVAADQDDESSNKLPFRKFHDYVDQNLILVSRCHDKEEGKMRIEPPISTQPDCYDTFNLFTEMGISWQFD